MFIYFPEFLYKTAKFYVKNTLPKLNEETSHKLIEEEFKFNPFNTLINKSTNTNKSLPTINLKHCFDFTFPKNKSIYDFKSNSISLCFNYIENYEELIALLYKEITYYNEETKLKSNNLNDIVCTSLKACRYFYN